MHFCVTYTYEYYIAPASAPTGLTVVSVDSTSANLTWDELPCFYQNGPIMGHVIRYTPDGGTAFTAQLPFGRNQIIELEPCTRCTLMVAVQNDAGIGIFSSSLSVVTNGIGKFLMLFVHRPWCVVCLLSMLTDVPGKVVFNQAITTLTSITISWTPPSDDNGRVVEYQVHYIYNGTHTTVTTTETKYVLEELIPATSVQFSVSAVSICKAVGETSTAIEHTIEIGM